MPEGYQLVCYQCNDKKQPREDLNKMIHYNPETTRHYVKRIPRKQQTVVTKDPSFPSLTKFYKN